VTAYAFTKRAKADGHRGVLASPRSTRGSDAALVTLLQDRAAANVVFASIALQDQPPHEALHGRPLVPFSWRVRSRRRQRERDVPGVDLNCEEALDEPRDATAGQDSLHAERREEGHDEHERYRSAG